MRPPEAPHPLAAMPDCDLAGPRLTRRGPSGFDGDVLGQGDNLHLEPLEREERDHVVAGDGHLDNNRRAAAVKPDVVVRPGDGVASVNRPRKAVLVDATNGTAPDTYPLGGLRQ